MTQDNFDGDESVQSGELIQKFLAEEVDAAVVEVVIGECRRRSTGIAFFEFNVFNLELDFESGRVTIEDVLNPTSDQQVPIGDFVSELNSFIQRQHP